MNKEMLKMFDNLNLKPVDTWQVGYSEYYLFYVKKLAVCVSYNGKAPNNYVASYGSLTGQDVVFIYQGSSLDSLTTALKNFIKE